MNTPAAIDANLIFSFRSLRFNFSFGLIPNAERNRCLRKVLWHKTFAHAIDKIISFSKAFTFSGFTLVSEALK